MSAARPPVELAPWIDRWQLSIDGAPFATPSSHLISVRDRGVPAMLKVARDVDEQAGGRLMAWWNGGGAAPVLAQAGDAVLLERARGRRSLAEMARVGQDDDATRILCDVAARLHAPRVGPPPALVPLAHWFRALAPAAATHGGILVRCATTAAALLADQREIGVLHGDLHHDNVLDFEARGWLAIDPKGLVGERAFDVANIFCNPDLEDPIRPVAILPERFASRLAIVAARARLDRRRLLQWILAWAGLSASWFLEDGDAAAIDLAIAEMAAAELDR